MDPNTNNKWAAIGILSNVGKDFIAGSVGGMSSVMAGHPFDTIKVMLQDASGNLPKFKNGYQALKYTIKVDGFKGIYRGLSVPLISVSFTNSIFFATNNFFQNFFHPPSNIPGEENLIPYHKAAAAGAIAGGVISLFITPRDFIKSKLQVQGRPFGSTNVSIQYKGPVDVIRKTIKNHGFFGMFKGIRSTFCRDVPGDAAYFVVYEFMKRKLLAISKKKQEEKNKLNGVDAALSPINSKTGVPAWVAIGAGGCAGMSFWASIYPMDVIKTRIQTQPDHLPQQYTGVIQCATKLYREEGISVFFRGFGATILRSFPTSAMNFLMYETTKNLLHSKFNTKDEDEHIYNAE
ncbi:hypothetical protein DICPUDRAFT_151115 [Dictyostelium purpureum]|uniref:Mitochondrial substrate carrier family protein n=1 Tax=Dictyostelium purpureum TaxID=5786 RepID=F0ZI10_DICPU|nr:uncharacterized protein DICPUDRAFT_151115 [Dictyostelium purpureum]EGC36429.1 hypothetical protein DICPUDRAFT_151115 [Dictyostelium purpureum]|eukprot:XP_003287062.1 hypothetical protein DICPUDRAFT_151115 [Dictyostelium purpureum]